MIFPCDNISCIRRDNHWIWPVNKKNFVFSFAVSVIWSIFAVSMTTKEKWCAFVATGFGSGFWPWGPGTAGAFVATVMWLVAGCFVSATVLFWLTLAAAVVATAAGTWTTDQLEPVWGEDPSRVVIDEMIGVWIPLLVCPFTMGEGWCGISTETLLYALAAFVLFRFFDILKPLGIRSLDRRHGGFWVMADDILAGIYSLIVIIVVRYAVLPLI